MSSDGHFFDILINDKNKLERKFMFKKEERTGIIVYLYYNRDVKKIEAIGDIVYHSKKSSLPPAVCRYCASRSYC